MERPFRKLALFHGLQQRGDLNCREMGEGIGDCIRQNDLVVVPHGSTCVDDVGDVSFALGWVGPDQRLSGSCENLGGIALVEERRAYRIFPDRPDAMGEQQPAFIEFDRRAAIADLYEFPWKLAAS